MQQQIPLSLVSRPLKVQILLSHPLRLFYNTAELSCYKEALSLIIECLYFLLDCILLCVGMAALCPGCLVQYNTHQIFVNCIHN